MLPACRTNDEGFTIPTFNVVPSDVAGFMDALWEFQSAFHDCFPRSEPRAHFFDYEDRSEEVLALQQRLGYIPAGPHVSATLTRLRQLPSPASPPCMARPCAEPI